MITDAEVEKANDFIRDHSEKYAMAKGHRIYLEQFRKSQKALLMQECDEKTSAAQETYAYAHDDYQFLLDGLKEAVHEEEKLRWLFVAAQTKIDIWRTQSSNNRKGV